MNPLASVALVIVGDSIAGGGGAERRFFRIWKFFMAHHSPIRLIINDSLGKSALKANLIDANDLDSPWIHIVPDGSSVTLSRSIVKILKYQKIRLLHLVLAQKKLLPLYFFLSVQSRITVTHTVALSWFAHPVKIPRTTFWLSRWLWSISKKIDTLYTGFIPQNAKRYGLTAKVSVSPCSFTDIEKFIRKKEKEKIIVFAGRLIPEKNPLLLIDALTKIDPAVLDSWHIVIAGDGPLKTKILAESEKPPLKGKVTIATYPDMSELFCRSSIFVSLQETENYPSQSLIEAMVSQNAVVATDVGETSRLVADHKTGLLISPDPDALNEALSFLINHDVQRETLGSEAKNFILSHHRIEIFADYLKTFWLSALDDE